MLSEAFLDISKEFAVKKGEISNIVRFIGLYHYYLIKFISLENNMSTYAVYAYLSSSDSGDIKISQRTKDIITFLSEKATGQFESLVELTFNTESGTIDSEAVKKGQSCLTLYEGLLDRNLQSGNLDGLLDYLFYVPGALHNYYKTTGLLKETGDTAVSE